MCIYNHLLDVVSLLLTIWFHYINVNVVLETIIYAMLSTVNTCELIIPKILLLYILCYHTCSVVIYVLLLYLFCYHIYFVIIFLLLSYLFCYHIGSVGEAACDYIYGCDYV